MLHSHRNTRLVEEDDNTIDESSNACKTCCFKAARAVFSHLGLILVVCGYTVAGAFIFRHLEQTNEQDLCFREEHLYGPIENQTLLKLWEISTSFPNPSDEPYAAIEFQKVLQQFRDNSVDLGYKGADCTRMGQPGQAQFQWNLPGAVLFCVTVITTIGYGNITPKTFWGRLVCIAYATLGIPLMLLCLANIGDVLADVFRYIYTRICCCVCCQRGGSKRNRVHVVQYSTSSRRTPEAWKSQYGAAAKGGPFFEESSDVEEESKVSIPLTITIVTIAGYIFMGALLFGVWEQWDALTASYFCFITISTIGFGDIVPGETGDLQNTEAEVKMLGAALYIVLGMAIISMCFSLIQEEMVAKFRWLAMKMGIISSKEEESGGIDGNGVADDEVILEKKMLPQHGQHVNLPPPRQHEQNVVKEHHAEAPPQYAREETKQPI